MLAILSCDAYEGHTILIKMHPYLVSIRLVTCTSPLTYRIPWQSKNYGWMSQQTLCKNQVSSKSIRVSLWGFFLHWFDMEWSHMTCDHSRSQWIVTGTYVSSPSPHCFHLECSRFVKFDLLIFQLLQPGSPHNTTLTGLTLQCPA